MAVLIAPEDVFDPREMAGLYGSVGWVGYTNDTGKLCRGLENSHLVLTARDESGRLLGLTRTLSDDESICYVQDLLVDPGFQRQGVGRALLEELKRRYAHCRFFLLATDLESTPDGKRNHAFYRQLGLISYEEKQLSGFALPHPDPM